MKKQYRQSKPRKPSFITSQAAHFFQLTTLNHQLVLPGETLGSHSINARLQSAPVKSVMAGAYFDIMTFYVPLRLLWDGWADYIALGEGTVPVMGADSPQTLSKLGDPQFPFLAFNHIAETFFESPFITDRTDQQGLPPVDYLADLMITDEAKVPDTPSIDLTVTGSTAELTSQQLRDLRNKERQQNRRITFSEPYADMLSMYGVDIKETVVSAEYLGGSRTFHYPSRTIDQSTGFSVASYMIDAKFKRDRKRAYFAEHGILIDLVCLRPKVFHTSKAASFDSLRTAPEHWSMLDDLGRVDASTIHPQADGDIDLRAPLYYGEERCGFGFDITTGERAYSAGYAPADKMSHYYPPRQGWTAASDLQDGYTYAVDCKVRSEINTWVKRPPQVELDLSDDA